MKDDYDLHELKLVDVRGLKFNLMPRYTYHYLDNDYEKFSLDMLDRLVEPGGTSIDIGAHYGIYSLLAAKQSKKVYAFEPVPENYEILKRNIDANQLGEVIVPINKAVSDKPGQVDFNVTWASDSAGFYQHPNAESIRTIQVQMCSIDDELSGLKDVSFIKIDTEGHEIHVLDGLRKTLRANPHAKMLIEYNPECLTNAGVTSTDLIAKISGLGYDIFALHEQSRLMVRVDETTSQADILLGGTYLNLLCLPENSWQSMLFVSHNSEIGGAELALLELTESLLKIKETFVIPMVVLPGDGPLTDRFKALPVPIKVVPMRGWVNSSGYNAEDRELVRVVNVIALGELARIFRQFKPQVVLSNTMVVPWGAIAAKAFNVPHVWSIHEFGDLDHGLDFDYGFEQTLKCINELSDKIITNSKAVEAHVGRFVSKTKLKTLYLGFKPAVLSEKAPIAVFTPAATLKLAVTGLIKPSKGQLDAVKALHALRKKGIKAELMLIGTTGPASYMEEIKAYSRKNGLDGALHIVGHKDNPSDYMAMADVYVMSSDNEAFGRVTVEAMLLGKPVVAARSGGSVELIKDGVSGYLYTPHSVDDLVSKIERAAEKSGISVGKAAKEQATSRFPNDYALRMLEVLKTARSAELPMHGLYKDVLLGLSYLQEMHDKTIDQMNETKRAELQNFSDEYNKAYKAYKDVDARLAELNSRKIVRLQHKIDHLKPKKRRAS